jgi:hypothetical protein
MRTKLALIAVSSFAVSAVCLGGAFALGGNQVGDAVFNFDGMGQPRCDMSDSSGATADTLKLSWDSDDRVAIAIPATIHYQAGVGDLLVVKGDPALISHIRVHNGTVELDCRDGVFQRHTDRVDITLPGRRTFQKFEMLGSGDMQLSGLSQPDAKIEIAGSGTVETEGKVSRLELEISGSGTVQSKGQTDDLHANVNGSGKMQLADLVAKDAHVDISGSGKVDVAPQNSLNVDISGSGTIYLHSEPRSVETDISGSGRIIHANGAVQDRHARLEKRYDVAALDRDIGVEVGAIVQQAIETGHGPDSDQLQEAEARLKERIRARVAVDIANAPIGDDGR